MSATSARGSKLALVVFATGAVAHAKSNPPRPRFPVVLEHETALDGFWVAPGRIEVEGTSPLRHPVEFTLSRPARVFGAPLPAGTQVTIDDWSDRGPAPSFSSLGAKHEGGLQLCGALFRSLFLSSAGSTISGSLLDDAVLAGVPLARGAATVLLAALEPRTGRCLVRSVWTGTLGAPAPIAEGRGARFPAGTSFQWNGDFASAEFVGTHRIDGWDVAGPCATVYPNGHLLAFLPAHDTAIDGLVVGNPEQRLSCDVVRLSAEGHIQAATTAKEQPYGPWRLAAHTTVTRWTNGRLRLLTLAAPAVVEGAELPAGTELLLDKTGHLDEARLGERLATAAGATFTGTLAADRNRSDGSVTFRGALAKTWSSGGLSFASGTAVELYADGRLAAVETAGPVATCGLVLTGRIAWAPDGTPSEGTLKGDATLRGLSLRAGDRFRTWESHEICADGPTHPTVCSGSPAMGAAR